jgi:hypothetical protein
LRRLEHAALARKGLEPLSGLNEKGFNRHGDLILAPSLKQRRKPDAHVDGFTMGVGADGARGNPNYMMCGPPRGTFGPRSCSEPEEREKSDGERNQ